MRVIAGEARGRRLQPLGGTAVRPTPDRVREALFSILTARLADRAPAQAAPGWANLRVLDLFAGSGALGIEALSRGAAHTVFVEAAPAAVAIVRANLERCSLVVRATVVTADAAVWLARARSDPGRAGGPFDLVLADPPYAGEHHRPVLDGLCAPLLAVAGLVVLEHETGRLLPESTGGLTRVDSRRYGRTTLSFYSPGLPLEARPVSAS